MDSIKKADSNLSVSSIISDSSPHNDDLEIAEKVNSMEKLVLEGLSNTCAENISLGSDITELLNELKFDIKSLPNDIKDGLQTVAAILKSEGLSSFDETALRLCMEERRIENKKKEREERLLKAKYNAAFAKYNTLEDKLNRVRKAVEQVEDMLKMSDDENRESNVIFLEERFHEYKSVIEKLEQELDSLHSQELELDKALNKSSKFMERLNELAPLNNTLNQYGDLPPNLLQAKNALEIKKRELEEIEALLYDKMNI